VCLWIQHTSIRVSRDHNAFDHSPGLFAVFHALHRLLAPRHPPHALSSLAALIQSSVVFPPSRNGSLPATGLSKSNDPFLLRALTETQKKLQNHRPWPLARARSFETVILRSCDCNSYRYRIVKELPSWNRPQRGHRLFQGVLPVETTGIEPATSGLQNRRSPN
jgi:hypothetical protein